MAVTRGLNNGNFNFMINGVAQGYCKSVKGAGKYTVDVHETKLGAEWTTKKVGTTFKVGEVTAEIGIGMGKALYDWIEKSFKYAHAHQDCSVVIADADNNASREIVLTQALVTKISVPKQDATSKEAGFITIGATPEDVKYLAASGKIQAPTGPKQKSWICSNFRLDIAGLDCTTVTSVDAFEWTQQTVVNAYGHLKVGELIPTGLKCGDLKITAASGVGGKQEDAWSKWVHSWIIDGNQTEKDHLSGTLTFLAQDMKTEMGSISFQGLGLKEFTPPDLSREDKARTFSATLYCEVANLIKPVTDA